LIYFRGRKLKEKEVRNWTKKPREDDVFLLLTGTISEHQKRHSMEIGFGPDFISFLLFGTGEFQNNRKSVVYVLTS